MAQEQKPGSEPQRSPAAELMSLFFRDVRAQPDGVNPGGGLIYICSLPNIRDDPLEPIRERHVCPSTATALDGFVRKWDRPRRGTYFCVGTTSGQKRSKEHICRTVCLHCDIDFKDVIEDQPTIRARIEEMRCPPTVIVFSGHGLHLYWLFREALDTQQERERIENALQLLAEVVGADPSVAEISRIMRLPGSHNTKSGDWREVRTEKLDGPRYELEDLEEWLTEATAGGRPPMLTRKVEAVRDATPDATSGEEPGGDAPRPPVDIEEALASMVYPGNVHDTQLRVTGNLMNAERPIEEAVAIVLSATRKAKGVDVTKWNWRTEERTIRDMCEGAIKKYPSEETILNAVAQIVQSDAASREGEAATTSAAAAAAAAATTQTHTAGNEDVNETVAENAGENVVNLGERRGRKPSVKSGSGTVDHIFIGEMFMNCLGEAGEGLMFTEQGAHRYGDGLWRLEDDKSITAWLNSKLETCIQSTTAKSTMKLINEARSWVIRQPKLQKHFKIRFDNHGKIPTMSGLVNPRTGEMSAPRPEDYCTWRIPFGYRPEAKCPHWLQMLGDTFADREPESKRLHIQIVQENLGAGLIDAKPKALSRALNLVGGSNFGKSSLLDVLSGLFGTEKNTTAIDSLDGNHSPHSLMPFAYRRPWVLHEAFDAGKLHFSSLVKALISGDEIQIHQKWGRIYMHKFGAPIFWGANAAANFREATKAIVNRLVVLDCRREFEEENPVGVALTARALGYDKPQELILATEMEGVLVWAIEGLRRALARGHFVLPEEAKEAADEIQRSSNIVLGFVEECLTYDGNMMVATADFNAAHASWWMENHGEDRRIPSGNSVGRAVTALADRRIAASKDLRTTLGRYYAGIRLNRDGKRHWKNTVESQAFTFQSRTANTTDPGGEPNVMIPGSWETKSTVQAMRAAHEKRRDRSQDGSLVLGEDEVKQSSHDDS